MMCQSTCGYTGHHCSGSVQFISRYRGENDYCLEGRRIVISDAGMIRRGTAVDAKKVLLYELAKYAKYVKWHTEQTTPFAELQPFLLPWPLTEEKL